VIMAISCLYRLETTITSILLVLGAPNVAIRLAMARKCTCKVSMTFVAL
jgi:hypothetical protein